MKKLLPALFAITLLSGCSKKYVLVPGNYRQTKEWKAAHPFKTKSENRAWAIKNNKGLANGNQR